MRVRHDALVCFAAIATLAAALTGDAFAQGKYSNGNGSQNNVAAGKSKALPRGMAGRFTPLRGNAVNGAPTGKSGNFVAPKGGVAATVPSRNGGYSGGGYYGGGNYRRVYGPGYFSGGVQPLAPDDIQIIDNGSIDNPPQNQNLAPQRTTQRNQSGAPPANERRMVPDEVVIELSNTLSAQQVNALQLRHRLTRIESQTSQLSGTTLYRWRITDRRAVTAVVRALEADGVVASAQPNYLFNTRQSNGSAAGGNDEAQYLLAKLHLPQAHALAMGDDVLVAVIDSGIDADHPELAGSVVGSFDALPPPENGGKIADNHGTAIAGLIAAHGKLMGTAPRARILAVRAFDPKGASAEGTTFSILKGLDWAVQNHARIINMSFAGPSDPAIHRSLEAAHKKGVVLIAAAGNAGPKSPPLYPAADAHVIAVTATDADDKLFALSNRGQYIAVAAPGAQILVAIPDAAYEAGSGTSYSAAEVSGIAALMLQRHPDLTPDRVRAILLATAKDLGPKGRDIMFGAGLVDAYGALTAEGAPMAQAVPLPVSRASTGVR
jgi:hypothetical protein